MYSAPSLTGHVQTNVPPPLTTAAPLNSAPPLAVASTTRSNTVVSLSSSTRSSAVINVHNAYSVRQPQLCCISSAFDTKVTIDVPQGSLTFEVVRGICCKTKCCSASSTLTTSILDVVEVEDNFAQTCSWIMAMVVSIPVFLFFVTSGVLNFIDIFSFASLSVIAAIVSWSLAVPTLFVAIYAAVRCAAVHL